jgi:HEAT repeat protein
MHPEAADVTDLARALLSPDRAVRDEAERALLADPDGAEQALVAALQGPAQAPDGAIARLALVVGAMRSRPGLRPLLGRLQGADDGTRAAIARALSEILDGRDAFDDAVTDALEALATDRDRTVRAYAAQAFTRIGDERSVARVRALADDHDPFVRQRAERMLASVGADVTPATVGDQRPNDAAAALRPWLADLGDRRRAVQEAAIAQLVAAGPKAVPPLVDRLHQPHPRVRIAAAKALGQLRSPEAAGPLLIAAAAPAVTPEDRPLAAVALRALVNCLTGEETGLAETLIGLADRGGDRLARAGALLCLGRIADREGIHYVVDALTDPDPLIVESATIALSEGVREDDTDLVIPLLETYDVRPRQGLTALREAILIALSRIVLDDPALRVRVRHRVRHEVDGPTASLRRLAIALCTELYAEDDPPVLPLVEAVIERLDDGHADVRVVAASFLAEHLPPGLTGGAARLKKALKRNEPLLTAPLIAALARVATPEAKEALLAATRHDDRDLALAAAEHIEQMGPSVEEWQFVRAPAPEKRSYTPRAGAGDRLQRPRGAGSPPEMDGPPRAGGAGKELGVPDTPDHEDNTGEGEAVEAVFVTEEGSPLTPAMSMPEGEMPAPGDEDEGGDLPPPDATED